MMPAKKNFHAYTEAQAAARALDIKSRSEYNKKYRKDPGLSSSPPQYYNEAGCIDWCDFLGVERPDFYPTYAGAQSVVRTLEIKSHSEYSKRYREDPRLPATPQKLYANMGWIDWHDFLDKA